MKRNQQLLTDLQRVDTQFQQLEIKLERLTNLKVFNILAIRTELFRFGISFKFDSFTSKRFI